VQSVVRAIVEAADRRNKPVRALLRRFDRLRRRHRWIRGFQATPKAQTTHFAITMFASEISIATDYTEEDPVGEPFIKYGALSGQRATGADALIKKPIPKGSGPQNTIRPPGFVSGKAPHYHHRGHLLGRQLGGVGHGDDGKKNLVTLYRHANTPIMRAFENRVRATIEKGEAVRYTVVPSYNETQEMPVAVTMRAVGSKKFRLTLSVLNRHK
jgi:hypothetical protein